MSDDAFIEQCKVDIVDIRRLIELDQLASSGRGITLDQNIERKDLSVKFRDQNIMFRLLEISERLLGVS